ncbi:MAG: peptide chain release factor N(5)-glutamine methyltransferase [Paracoccus sp. (in: a-proteobacteria)]
MSETTGRQLVLAARARLQAAGVPDARRDAERLFSHALEVAFGHPVPRHHLPQHLSRPASADLADAFAPLIEARAARQPVSQITGRRAFWKHEFRVTRDTLDPRPETETLVEAALALDWASVLDLGTGTGAILISLLAERPGAVGTGADVSAPALAVARDNAGRIGVVAGFRQSDWYAGIEGRFDLIVSNPPYIALSEMADLSPEVRDWEPHQALTDFGDGLAAYRTIAGGARAHLTPGGRVLVEIGPTQAEEVRGIFAAVGAEARVLADLDGRDRVVLAEFPAV